MSLIKVEDLTFCYPSGSENIFENVSFNIDADWRLGFVGRNGRGKTTFLNLLLGKYEYEGKIISSLRFDLFPFKVGDKSRLTAEILQEISPRSQEWELIRELSYLDVDAEVLWRPFEDLSNGERTKVMLAAMFLNENNFLLLDEPTNHLDLRGREVVSKYLRRKSGFILVSHDRCFLDGCVDHILSINKADIEVCKGDFSTWLKNKTDRDNFETAQNEKLEKEISRLSDASKRSADWSKRTEKSKNGTRNSGLRPDKGYIGHKSAKMMKRSKSLEERRSKALSEKSSLMKNVETAERLKLSPLRYRSEILISASDLCIFYDKNIVCGPVSFSVGRGERLAVEGKNGSGKSSILKAIVGEPIEYTGKLRISPEVKISYVQQDSSSLSGSLSDLARQKGIDESLFKAILRKLGFERAQFEQDTKEFSEGQKKKTFIAASLCEQAHLYIWDEPLNYLDIYSRMQLERLLEEFSPTMILIEHDRAFIENAATGTLEL